jgi:gliding motility-associated-like protein
VHTNCDSLENKLTWTNPNNYCADDVMKYKVFYTNQIESELILIATINNPEDTILFHKPSYGPAGCYAVSAIDSFENESERSVIVCVDECSGYDLPNVFTPNNDGYNDVYKSINPGNYVKRVEMKIFNRWGNIVYETEDPNINWDGRSMENNQLVSSGVYYYICDVYEPRLIGVVVKNMVGFIHVYAENAEDTLIE